ncbi:MAG: DUF368 domain-containing protein [Pseudomonadota bacterium]
MSEAQSSVLAPVTGGLVSRSAVGGVLMGLANLVPGISGGTMLLATGVYPDFIRAIAELSTFKFNRRSLVVVVSVAIAAALAIVLFAGPIKDLVVNHRWVMYSLFIGLTLGGVPFIWKMFERMTPGAAFGALLGFVGMAALGVFQGSGVGAGGGASSGFLFFVLAGIAGASAMVLPGISGGYLWLVMGVYVPILGAIAECKALVTARDWDALWTPVIDTIVPLGLGVLVGVVVVSNLLNWALNRHRTFTLGVLLGLLVGAVVGLWPYQQGVAPSVGDQLKGQVVEKSEDGALRLSPSGRAIERDDYPTAYFAPTSLQIGGALGLIIIGFIATQLIGRIGRANE